jgi:hypothetical protein
MEDSDDDTPQYISSPPPVIIQTLRAGTSDQITSMRNNPLEYLEIIVDFGDIKAVRKLLENNEDIFEDSSYTDVFSSAIKNAIFKEEFEIAKYLLEISNILLEFNEEDQRSIIIDSSIEKMSRYLNFFRYSANRVSFEIYENMIDYLIDTKLYDKFAFLIRNQYILLRNLNLFGLIMKSITENDSVLINMLCPFIETENSENINQIIYNIYENGDEKEYKRILDTFKTFIRCQNVYNNITVAIIKSIIVMATETRDNDLYDYIITHPLFVDSANELANVDNLVYFYIEAFSNESNPIPEMAQHLMRSENYVNLARTSLIAQVASNLDNIDYSIFELFVNDSQDILFNAMNIVDVEGGNFVEASSLFSSIFYIQNEDSYKKIEIVLSEFMPEFTPISRGRALDALMRIYTRNDENIDKKVIADLILNYGREYNLFNNTLNFYLSGITENEINPAEAFTVLFELFNVDEIERLVLPGENQIENARLLFREYSPLFTPVQIAFLYSKCHGKSRNRKEFIRTLRYITGIEYNIEDAYLMNYESEFKYDESISEVFRSVLMGFIGLGEIQFEPRNEPFPEDYEEQEDYDYEEQEDYDNEERKEDRFREYEERKDEYMYDEEPDYSQHYRNYTSDEY